MKKLICILLCLAAVFMCACSEEASGKAIRSDVVDAYDLTAAQQKQVEKLFKDFDAAFNTLKNSSKTENDFYAYTGKILALHETFKESGSLPSTSELLDKETDRDKREKISLITAEYSSILFAHSEILFKQLEGASGEACLEAALNLVYEYSMFFYGEPMYTEADLDALGL